ncbi:MAG: hypothetical protein WHS38_03520 [Thermodesulforhabdaceae bacterium]
MTKPSSQIPIFFLVKTPEVVTHFNALFHKVNWKVTFCDSPLDLFDHIKTVEKAIIFVEGAVSLEEGPALYDEILKRCPEAKIILVCSQAHRKLIKDMIEKGGYGSILEPYDPWEITTMVKHLMADLAEKTG